jgi:integrase
LIMNAHTIQVLETTFDAHNRGKQLKRDIAALEKVSLPANKKLLQEYNEKLELDFHKGKVSLSAWQKNISEARVFAAFFNKPILSLEKKDIEKWFKAQEARLLKKEITAWTFWKYTSQARKLLLFAFKQPSKKYLDCFDWLHEEMPAKPKRQWTASEIPSQTEIKRLIAALYVDGKRFSIRNQALVALCNDIGCRISEALAIRCKDIKPEENYLVITLPQSKTEPRTIISFLAKPYLEAWAKARPSKAEPEGPFFCSKDNKIVRYELVRKALNKALKKTGIVFPKNKGIHFFRALFATRSFAWATPLRNYWLGWSTKGMSDIYTALNYKACAKPYFEMLKAEANPMLSEDMPYWQEEALEKKDQALILRIVEAYCKEHGILQK